MALSGLNPDFDPEMQQYVSNLDSLQATQTELAVLRAQLATEKAKHQVRAIELCCMLHGVRVTGFG